ncbi:MAG: hypothetical protein CMC14_14455 [Flavobacteriaceae bacterium]|nr:hypothetical protein [Flavobacteriaceae bacterium]|tara:strand:- start:783 stop:1016 length:234 start_codon:yes stop_codon:yes gene_type:complete
MNDRILASKLVEDFLSGKIDFKQFAMDFPEDENDSDLSELFDLIEHKPKVGGLFGESKSDSNRRMERINELIATLKT